MFPIHYILPVCVHISGQSVHNLSDAPVCVCTHVYLSLNQYTYTHAYISLNHITGLQDSVIV